MAFIGGGESGSDSDESQTAANQQPITLDQFLEIWNEIRKDWGLPPKKYIFEETVLQNLNDSTEELNAEEEIVYSKEELNVKDQITLQEFVESVESGREDFSYEKESLKDLQLFDLKEIFPELLTQQKGKYLKTVGIFKIKKKIGNATLQFLYKNGLFNLSKECWAVFKEQDIVDIQYQMENKDFVLINAAGGIKVKKKRKRKREKGKQMVMKI